MKPWALDKIIRSVDTSYMRQSFEKKKEDPKPLATWSNQGTKSVHFRALGGKGLC